MQAKRQKTGGGASLDPSANPYLAHHYEEEQATSNGYSNGVGARQKQSGGALARITRHKSTDAQAREAEDGPLNPFTGKQLSKQYFNILEKRRGLPVHAQR